MFLSPTQSPPIRFLPTCRRTVASIGSLRHKHVPTCDTGLLFDGGPARAANSLFAATRTRSAAPTVITPRRVPQAQAAAGARSLDGTISVFFDCRARLTNGRHLGLPQREHIVTDDLPNDVLANHQRDIAQRVAAPSAMAGLGIVTGAWLVTVMRWFHCGIFLYL